MGSRMCINMYTYIFRKQKKEKVALLGITPPVMHEREEREEGRG